MLLYRRPPSSTSPLWSVTLHSDPLANRLRTRGDVTVSTIGVVVSFLILFLIAALRYGIGTDYWFRYAPLFDQIQYGNVDGQEVGYLYLNKVVAYITSDYQGIFVATSLLTVGLFYRFFLRMSINPALSVFIYAFGGFYLEDFNLVKQGLAIAIVLNSIEYALRKKHLTFITLTLLAASFHVSALVWFAIWPFMWVRLRQWVRIALSLAIIGVVLLMPGTAPLLVDEFAPEYAWYFVSNYGVTRSINAVVVIVAIGAFVFTLVKVGRSGRGDRYADSIINVFAVSTAVLVATMTIAYLFSRLNYYFDPAQIIALPLALSLVKGARVRHVLTFVFMSAYMTSFVFQFLIWNAHGVMPYESIFSR